MASEQLGKAFRLGPMTSQSNGRYCKSDSFLPFIVSLVYRCSKSIKGFCFVVFCTALFSVFLLVSMGCPSKYHGENKQPLRLRVTPTGVRMLTDKYIGPGKLADNVATLLEELAIGNIVATPASVGPLWGMPDAESTIGAVITDLTVKLEEAKKTISDMETLKDSTRVWLQAL